MDKTPHGLLGEMDFFSGKSGKATNKISSFDSYVVAFFFTLSFSC